MASEEPSGGLEEAEARNSSSASSASLFGDEDGHGDEEVVDPWAAFRGGESDGSRFEPSEESPSSPVIEASDAGTDVGAGPAATMGDVLRRPKRPARPSLDLDHRPLKRTRGTFNSDYVTLLNADIEDAATRYVSHGWPKLPPSQIGLIVWTPQEKELFFEALSRLGRDDVEGIACRIKTKGALEVRQYLGLLQKASAARTDHDELEAVDMADVQAARELGVKCCHALDEAADAAALRQEAYEESLERTRWGEKWLCSSATHEGMEAEAQPSSVGLFKLKNWLALSERLFMNAPSEEGNWRSVGELPSIRTTAVEDFYSLAVSVTERLISAAMYISMSRIRSKRAAVPWTRNLIRRRDVVAAAASLGLERSPRSVWVGMARRLKLDVYEEVPRNVDDDDGPLPYGEVEQRLSALAGGSQAPFEGGRHDEPSTSGDASSDSPASVADLIKLEISDSEDEGGGEHHTADGPNGDLEAHREALEVTEYSALGFPRTGGDLRGLINRIKAERQQEAYADVVDRLASSREEKGMWALLGREPPGPLDSVESAARPRAHAPVEDVHPSGKDWRDKLGYMPEWEAILEARLEGAGTASREQPPA